MTNITDRTRSLVEAFPTSLLGEKVDLLGVVSAWRHVKKLDEMECEFFAQTFDRTRDDASVFRSPLKYRQLCARLGEDEKPDISETSIPTRFYWIYAPTPDRIVGWRAVFVPPRSQATVAFACAVLPAHRRKGYSAESLKLISDYALQENVASSACVETRLSNKKSPGAALKAGFREVSKGICSVAPFYPRTVRRFLNNKTGSNVWPIDPGLN